MEGIDRLNPDNEALLNATQFGDLIGCTFQAIKKMMDTGKLTEGISYLREGRDIMIDSDKAKAELRLNTKPSTCKNKQLLTWLGMDNLGDWEGRGDLPVELVEDMNIIQVREEQARSELRLSLMEEQILSQKYVERKIVEKNLESMGIEVRNAFLGIGTRIVEDVRNAYNVRDAENIITKEIEDVLERLSKIHERDVTI